MVIGADLVSVRYNGETENKHGQRDDRVGGEKREMEGNGRIYMSDKWTIFPAVPCHTLRPPDNFPPAVSTDTILAWSEIVICPPLLPSSSLSSSPASRSALV